MMKKLVVIALAVVIGLSFSQCNSVDKQLKETAAMMNKSYPKMVDSETRIDSVSVPASREIHQHYTLVNMTEGNMYIDQVPITKEQLASSMRLIIIRNLNTNPAMDGLKKEKVTFVYEYNYADGKHMMDIKFTPEDYK